LKYSQLIQILGINLRRPAVMRFAAPIAARINRGAALRNSAKASAGGAKAAFAAPKTAPSGLSALYAALTLSRSSAEIDAGRAGRLAKPVMPCMHAGNQ
jgi:hypothetical protein